MKKTILFGTIAFIFAATLTITAQAQAATEVAAPDIPSDYEDVTKWPFQHTEFCMPTGKEYRSTAYVRITDDKKMESVLTTSLGGTIFRYRHDQGNGGPDFIIDFIETEKGWVRIDVLLEYEETKELVEKYMLKNGVPPKDYGAACAKIIQSGFGKFWNELFKKLRTE